MNSIKKLTSPIFINVKFTLLVTIFLNFASAGTQEENKIQGIEWILKQHNECVYSNDMLKLLNNIETMEQIENNERKGYYFETEDFELLTKRCGEDADCMNKKYKSLVKYNKKLESLQCLNAAIVNYTFTNIQYLKKGNTSYHNITARMLSLLYNAKIPAHNWLWSFYLRMEPNNGRELPGLDKYFPEIRLQDDLIKHLDYCRTYKYLSVNLGKEAGELKFEKDKLKRLCRQIYNNNSSDDAYLLSIYSGVDQLQTRNFALSNVNEHKGFLFKKIEKIDLNWETTKLMLNTEKSTIINQLYGIEGYYKILAQVVKVNVLYLIWRHFVIVQKSLERSFEDPAFIHSCRKISLFKNSLKKSMNTIFEILGVEDVVLNNIYHILMVEIADLDFNKIFNRKLEWMNRDLKNIILEDLLNLEISTYQAQALLNIKTLPFIVSQTDLNTSQYSEHLDQLDEYLNGIKLVFPSFPLLEYFINGYSSLEKTFFMYI
ncbi:uncharacterized protein LOC126898770 [Daktulosphaira vitifoliae]|uniref:uncharacterized protein LOC126898770 n=1 Tax=Daktulosphaira vitifoliae TaxID=58002 RepID=UPI0021AA1FC8|nr:uncharacterized protein LOC126898770 [Daktulosphaira vitifoliae]